jgi:hypothetical protein
MSVLLRLFLVFAFLLKRVTFRPPNQVVCRQLFGIAQGLVIVGTPRSIRQ